MKETYTILESKRDAIEKKVNRVAKKAARYNASLSVKYSAPYAKEVPVYYKNPDEDGPRSMLCEVFDLTIESDIVRKNGYTIVARLEHADGGNIVDTFGCECSAEWTTMKPHCDHCNGNHGQRVTFIVRGNDGEEKQVGRTCLMEYCGIDPQGIGIFNELNAIIIDDTIECEDWEERPIPSVYDTIKAIAFASKIQRENGYVSSSCRDGNKYKLIRAIGSTDFKPSTADYAEAKKIADGVRKMSIEDAADACLNNVKTLVECGYCKESHFGYIAYAPLGFERYEKRIAKEAERNAVKQAEALASNYVGNVGQRLIIDVSDMMLITSWETDFGCTYLYKFIDANGNVLIWFASRTIDNAKKIKGTVKEHTERDGVKQTIVTRCSVVA